MSVVLDGDQVVAIQAAIAVVGVRYHGNISQIEVEEPITEDTIAIRAVVVPSNPRHHYFLPTEVRIQVNLQDMTADFDGERCWLLREWYYSVPVITHSSHAPIKVPAYVDLSSL